MPDEHIELPKLTFDDQVQRSTFDKTGGESVQPTTTSRPRPVADGAPPAPFPQAAEPSGSTAPGTDAVELPNLDFDAPAAESETASTATPGPSTGPYSDGPNMAAAAGPMYSSPRTWREKIPGAQYAPSLPQVLLALLVAGGLYVWQNWNREIVPTETDRNLVVSASWLAEYSREFEFLPSAEHFVMHSSLFGNTRLDYDYVSGETGQPEVHTTIRMYSSASEAEDEFKSIETANRLAWQKAGQGSVGITGFDEDCTWGDESRAYTVELRGEPAGHSFYARMGKRRIDVTISGVVFRDGWELFEVLKPALRNLAAYRP